MASFVVLNTNDSGLGSLRQAILDANLALGDDEITFDAGLATASIFTNLSSFDITDTLTINFDIDGDGVGDADIFYDINNANFLNLNTAGVALTLDRGNITVDVDETQTTDTFTFSSLIAVTANDVTITNNSNITSSGVVATNPAPGDLVGDFSDVVGAFAVNNFTFINETGGSIVTTGREAVDATFSTNVNIVNDGTLISADDAIRIGTGTITNSGLIESTGEYEIPGGGEFSAPGFASDGIAIINDAATITPADFAVAEGPVHVVNTVAGTILGHRAGIQFFGGGVIDNDGFIAGETTAIGTGSNGSLFASSFVLNNNSSGILSNNGTDFGFTANTQIAAVINTGGFQSVTINNSGLISSQNLGIFTLDGTELNNMSGGQILSDLDGSGDDAVAFYSAHLEDFTVEASIRTIDPVNGFVSSQGITLDSTFDNFLLPDGSVLAPNPGQIEAAFIAGVADILPLIDIDQTLMSGTVVLQTDANGTLYPPTIDVVSPTLGTLTVTFVSGQGFTVTDANGNPAFDVPERNFDDNITNEAGALIDGDVLTGLGDDALTNAGEITGDVDLGDGDDRVVLLETGSFGGDVDGGEGGIDILSFLGQSSRIVFATDGVTDIIDGTTFTNFGYYEATDFDDVFTITGTVGVGVLGGFGNDRLTGGSGDDFLIGEAGNDNALGGDGADVLVGGDGRDRLFGQGGNDTLVGDFDDDLVFGGDGDDFILGGDGDDIVFGQDGNDQLFGDAGDDFLRGGDGVDELFGGNDNDRLNGDAGNDRLFGEDGDDVLDGGNGDDFLRGGFGDDRIMGGIGDDLLAGDEGNDTLLASFGNDSLFGASGDDTLFGEAGADIINGGSGVDFLRGGTGNDTLRGDAGDDRLIGDAGNDALFGGTGADVLIGGAGADSFAYTVGSGLDRVSDFELGIDTIFVDADFGLLGFADLDIVQQGTSTLIRLMPGGADALLLFNTVATDLTAADFVFEDPTALTPTEDVFFDFGTEEASEEAVTAQAPDLHVDLFELEAIQAVFEANFDSHYDLA